jgi:hypothetical protein
LPSWLRNLPAVSAPEAQRSADLIKTLPVYKLNGGDDGPFPAFGFSPLLCTSPRGSAFVNYAAGHSAAFDNHPTP